MPNERLAAVEPVGSRTVRSCVYRNCEWEYAEPWPASFNSMQDTEAAIKAHLNAAHEGWTLDEVRREATERQSEQLSAVMKAGPREMFG